MHASYILIDILRHLDRGVGVWGVQSERQSLKGWVIDSVMGS